MGGGGGVPGKILVMGAAGHHDDVSHPFNRILHVLSVRSLKAMSLFQQVI